ncbi:MAG: circularly permuted type 2 ATP-grasp protein [Methylobacter sp.]
MSESTNSDMGGQFNAARPWLNDGMERKAFIDSITAIGSGQLELRRREAQRLLRENGVTYNGYGDSQKLNRPWLLDPIPLPIASAEWSIIETGLKQRAELLNLVLKDIYGKQRLLKQGLLPSELVLAHDGFLHACVGTLNRLPNELIVYSANLAQDRNGRVLVLDDRTQAPSGAGYALENRTVMKRVLPELFRESQVGRLSEYFKALRKGLADIAPHNKETPRIVILTPGPLNETYFEHAYLASYLGFSLVQGDDLTVRDGRVWLKLLNGLQPVDVILRRVDDSFCDPLELRNTSRLGVAGLLEAVRRNNVAIANPLGSSVLENPGLLPFLPKLSQYFLNQDLTLPSIDTWWCGHRLERCHVLNNLDRLVIKPVNRSPGSHALFGGQLSTKEKERLRAAIIAKPHYYVGQEYVDFAASLSFSDHQIEPRYSVLRSFAVANSNDYHVMPGGLTRIARRQDDFIVSNKAGGVSKDTWVLGGSSQRSDLWLQPNQDVVLSADIEPLTSRTADSLFWVGRYLERIKAATRLMRSSLSKMVETEETGDPTDRQCLKILLTALTQITYTYPGFVGSDESVWQEPQHELLALAKNSQRVGTIAANIQAFAQTAFCIRDVWSQDTWRCIDNIQRRWQQRVINNPCDLQQLQKSLDGLITSFVAFVGLVDESMTREAGWLMLDSGRRLEHALELISLLRATVVQRHEPALQNQLLEALLTSTDSLSIYRGRYRSFIKLPMILELLLMDESHPRSLAYQLNKLSAHIDALPRETGKRQLSEEERLILKTCTDLRLIKIPELLKADDHAGVHTELENILSAMSEQLWRLNEVLAQAYFNHSETAQLITPAQAEDDL